MIDTLEVETRLRATFEAVAATTPIRSDLLPPGLAVVQPTANQSRSRGVLVAATSIGVIVIIAAAALVVLGHNAGQSVKVSTAPRREQPLAGEPKLVANASYEVPSGGMSPTLQIGDIVSATTKFGAIERGDVVRVRFPRSPGTLPVPPGGDFGFKRVVGLPGDIVEGRNGHLLVNGHELTEPYVRGATTDFPRAVVPRDSYFLLGDNRPNSADSRQWGSVRRSEIIAIALRITAPAARAGAIAGSPR